MTFHSEPVGCCSVADAIGAAGNEAPAASASPPEALHGPHCADSSVDCRPPDAAAFACDCLDWFACEAVGTSEAELALACRTFLGERRTAVTAAAAWGPAILQSNT